ncbi:MAG: ribonuclease HII [Bacteroidales bacterium]|nr:ribonuclease HII [Bacteroidales bacterium]
MLLQKFFKEENIIECGCDEAGRGCLAGPVVAAAVVLPRDFDCKELNDSKQLSDSKRRLLRPIIEEKALAWAVAFVDNETIDRINILNASFLAMSNAVRKLNVKPDLLLIDSNRFKSDLDIPFECIVKGDGKFQSIAAASILAKTYRDDFMIEAHLSHPQYYWNKNMGYPTKQHREAIKEFGMTSLHRKSFNHGEQLSLF